MAQENYRAICQFCGKSSGSKVLGPASGAPPTYSPTMPGKCPSSPTGKHMPHWVKV